jgi:NADH-quinone oxidoreductase subunit N
MKRLLAYSTISHTGFILAGLLSTNPEAIKMSMLYIIIYFIITIASFCFILSATISNNYFPKYLGS